MSSRIWLNLVPFSFSLNEERLPTSWNYPHIFLEFMMFSTSLTTVILALLTRLGCFQILTNDANLLFCLLDHVRSKELSFTGFCLEFMMSSTSLNSGVASRILSAEWTTKRLISKITSHIESTRFAEGFTNPHFKFK